LIDHVQTWRDEEAALNSGEETRKWNEQVNSLEADLQEVSTQLRKDRDALQREIGKNRNVDSLITQLQGLDLSGIQQ
jgi:predicted  nucleic acid-binding Zn-ribbon protein